MRKQTYILLTLSNITDPVIMSTPGDLYDIGTTLYLTDVYDTTVTDMKLLVMTPDEFNALQQHPIFCRDNLKILPKEPKPNIILMS